MKSDNVKNTILGSTAAIGATVAVNATSIGNIGIAKTMQKIGDLPDDTIEILHKTAEEAIEKTGIDKKGVKIEYLKKPPISKGLKAFFSKNITEQVKEGIQACFVIPTPNINQYTNKILMPEKALSFSAFHEIGHAMNANLTKWGPILQKMRIPGMIATMVISLYGACSTNSKPKDRKNLNAGQKTNNFIRNNAGKLAFGAMLPMLMEEAMATIKGNKLAKSMLSPKMFKIIAKGNAVGYLSYLLTATISGVAAWSAVKVKDHFTDKKTA